MYAPFFGLQQEAFSIAPDPRFLHLSVMHREALAHLIYGLQAGGGFVLLTGDIGTGKTTLCRCFLEQVPPGHRVAYLYNPTLTPVELLQTVCQEFGIDTAPADTVKPYIDALNRFLLDAHAQGQQCLLVVDEAQALSAPLLELLRLLTNLETNERKLLQIVLIGQPELRDMLARPELEQLAQRIIARVHLGPLTAAETADYVRHRLSVAGLGGEPPFDRRALALVHRLSGGVPRRINLLCQRALLGAYATGTTHIGPAIVRQAAQEVEGSARSHTAPAPRAALAGMLVLLVLLVLGLGGGAWWWLQARTPAATASTAPSGPAASATSAAATLAAPEAMQGFANERSAWSALAALWSLPAGNKAEVCAAALTQGLACHDGSGDLALLHRLQRPMLLQLGSGVPVLLQSIGPKALSLQGSQGTQQLPVALLPAVWPGSFSTLWRPPPGWLAAGEKVGPETADWVFDHLQALQGQASGSLAQRGRDEALRQRVFAFQVGQGLALDGVAGPITLMQLNRAAGIDEPRLRAAEPGP